MKPAFLINIGIFCVLLLLISGCQSVRTAAFRQGLKYELRHSDVFHNQFTGLCIYDPQTDEYVLSENDRLYFTPASNMKVLTALATLESFSDSIPAFAWAARDDTLVIRPLGDASFLHARFPYQKSYEFLRDRPVRLDFPPFHVEEFGPGWAWEDYQYHFQPERSVFPIYGNIVRIYREDTSIQVRPAFFTDYTQISYEDPTHSAILRDKKYNLFRINVASDTATFERQIPFDYDGELLRRLLSDTLQSSVDHYEGHPVTYRDTLYSQPVRHILAAMMLPSDNFLAEQLLIQSSIHNRFTSVESYQRALLTKWSSFLSDPVYWYDGSGLSRYNLVTPRSMVQILNRIYTTQDWSVIRSIFPAGGQSGTLKNWYSGTTPYVFAKTGTLRNNHNLSGYLVTRKGKVLIFSFMNNNYTVPVYTVKYEMEKILVRIRDRY